MGKMGAGYGSEFHLLRYLGYHRHELNRAVEKETRGRVIDWLDLAFGHKKKLDREWAGLDFLDATSDVKSAWVKFWPHSGNVPNWDAVGLLETPSRVEYVLVEAKAHAEELRSSCSAKKKGGLDTIRDALMATIKTSQSTADIENWLRPYYQYANRLVHLHFLLQNNTPVRLVFIYFCGDDWGGRTLPNGEPPKCPKDEGEWDTCLHEMYNHLGLNGHSELESRVHRLFPHIRHG